MSNEHNNLPALDSSVPGQVAAALETIRSALSGLHVRVDMLQAASEASRSDKHRDRNEMQRLATQIALVERDVQQLTASVRELDDMVVRGDSPLRDRVTAMEREQKSLVQSQAELEATQEEDFDARRQDSSKRMDRTVQIILTAAGWVIAVTLGIVQLIAKFAK